MTVLKQGWQFGLVVLLGLLIWTGIVTGTGGHWEQAIAAPDPSQQSITEVSIHLGTTAGELRFVPDHLAFETGKRYKLTLDNPSSLKHYFTAKDFADGIWTQKVDAGNVEVKGAVHELELRPGAIAEWVFIPLKSGTYELHCSVPGHAEAGMKGILTVGSSA
jgi:uncharacterized cupredoxin-like copper-binding protein